jgi:AAA15 family ATPase/GTPase
MSNHLRIENFKSIKFFDQEVKRVNIFIGEPNTGKSNILEALGFISYLQHAGYSPDPKKYIRYNRTSNLFYDESIENPIKICLDNLELSFSFSNHGTFTGTLKNKKDQSPNTDNSLLIAFSADHNNINQIAPSIPQLSNITPINYYKFNLLERSTSSESDYLLPPDGPNLLSVLLTKPNIRNVVNSVFSRSKLRLVLKPQDNSIEAIKDLGDVLVSYPYILISDTIQRVVFHLCSILSNKNATLVFEEPESHAFPYYTKQLAEIMALDTNNNRYFIATHNPYFLQPIIEKTAADDIAVFITYFDQYQTKVKLLSPQDIEEIMQIDVFSNLDRYIEKP